MLLNDVPVSERKALSNDKKELASALAYIGPRFAGFHIIDGAPNSGRILLTTPEDGAARWDHRKTVEEILLELEAFRAEARYASRGVPEGSRKGWEIRQTLFHGRPAAIIWAAWIH